MVPSGRPATTLVTKQVKNTENDQNSVHFLFDNQNIGKAGHFKDLHDKLAYVCKLH